MPKIYSKSTRSVLGLRLPTDPRWVNLAEKSLDEILTDHAYCEQKAAISCISLIQKYAHYPKLAETVAPLVTEEWGHFRQVLKEIISRGYKLGRQRKDLYVNQLINFCQKGGKELERLVDQLLLMALIEARSCERFKRLSEGLNDEYLRIFYRQFMESEAGHYTLFIQLAEQYETKAKVRLRWSNFLEYEANVLSNLSSDGKTIH